MIRAMPDLATHIHCAQQTSIYLVDIRPLIKRDRDKAQQLLVQQMVVRALLCYLLGDDVALAHEANGRPYLASHPDLSLSISHCPTAVAVALASNTTTIGIDIESKSGKAAKLLKRYASEQEQARMKEDNTSPIELWSAKETVYKLSGGEIKGFGEKIIYQGREGETILMSSMPEGQIPQLHHVRVVPLPDGDTVLTFATYPSTSDHSPSIHHVDQSLLSIQGI
ncbi:MAG: 4'-phosphopantetheinyl transferase superfamily protein [Porphyromonas sp.]|nr:4'-phosphopantetheinyl transferase superfamily protein [Porphyromonas sp.]